MKKLYALSFLLLFTFISHQSFAQFPLGKQKAKLSGLRVTIGGFSDSYANLSPEGLFSMLKPNQNSNFNLADYERMNNGYAVEMTGGTLGLNLIFNPKRIDGSIRANREIRVGANLGIGREVMIDMRSINMNDPIGSIGLCVIENSFSLDAAYLFKAPITNFFEVYAGPGANFGGTFSNRFLFVGDPNDTGDLKARNSNYVRGHLIAGATIGADRLFFQLEGKLGAGAQIVHNGKANILGTYALQIGVGYRW